MAGRTSFGSTPLLHIDDGSGTVDNQPSRWVQWRGRIICAAAFTGSLVLRIKNLSRWSNGLASVGTGFFFQCALESNQSGETLARIRQVCLTVFGATVAFTLSQWYANVKNYDEKAATTHMIISFLGVAVASMGRWLIQNRGFTAESQLASDQVGDTLNIQRYFSDHAAHLMKVGAFITFVVGAVLLENPVLQLVSAFSAADFLMKVVGERSMDWLDRKIQATDGSNGTKYRSLKTGLLTAGICVQLLSFTSIWRRATDTAGQLLQLAGFGASYGLIDGLGQAAQRRRIEQIPAKHLEELKRLPPWRSCADKIWKYAVPILSIGGMITFVSWQLSLPTNGKAARIALWGMLTGFLAGYGFCKGADLAWKSEERDRIRDEMMAQVLSFRIAGINPLHIYFAGTNATNIDSEAINAGENPEGEAVIFAAWFAYGLCMGRELELTSSDRQGNPYLNCPRMLLFNALATQVNSMKGVVP